MQIAGVELENLQFENIGSWPPFLRKAMILLIGLVTLMLGYFFYLSDLMNQLDALVEERQKLQESFVKTQDQVVNLEAYRNQVNQVRQSLDLLTQQLPTSNDEANLLEELSGEASSSGLQFQSIKPLPEEYKGFYIEQPIQLSFYGNYHSFGEFVSNILNLKRIVTLHDFTLKDPTAGSGKLEITVNAKSYWVSPGVKKP